MGRPIILKGVIHGKTILLDEETFLPDGYRVTLDLMLTPEESVKLSAGTWADMTPEEVADFEEYMTEVDGEPYKMPGPDRA